MERTVSKTHNQSTLQSLDLVLWRVRRAKEKLHQDEVHRQLNERPRLRRETQH